MKGLMIAGGALFALVLLWWVGAWLRRLRRGGPNPMLRYLGAWEDLPALDGSWTEAVAQSRRMLAGLAKLDMDTGRWLRHGTAGSDDSVVVGLGEKDEITFFFWGGQLTSISHGDDSYDDTCSELKGIARRAKELLDLTREQCGHPSLGAEDDEPEAEGNVRKDRQSVEERRRAVAQKAAKLGGPKVPKHLQPRDDDEDEDAPKRTKKKKK
jgi:hypothetical protein